jgi:1-acyl-sn-glycerol-3-phosphate acyltransferase
MSPVTEHTRTVEKVSITPVMSPGAADPPAPVGPRLKPVRTTIPASLPGRILHRSILSCLVAMVRFGRRVSRRVTGMERLDRIDSPYIIACNHVSLLDSPVIHTVLPRRHARRTAVVGGLDFFAPREDLSRVGNGWRRLVVRFIRSSLNVVLINRSGGDYSNLEQIEDLLSRGWNLVIFPEATRSRSGELGRLRLGAAELAKRFRCPIVPTHLEGTNEVLPVGASLPGPGRIRIRFGEPMMIGESETTRCFMERVGARITELGEEEWQD